MFSMMAMYTYSIICFNDMLKLTLLYINFFNIFYLVDSTAYIPACTHFSV